MRGHGGSDRQTDGYHVWCLVTATCEVLLTANLQDVDLLGYSVGRLVSRCYLDLFGAARLSRLILADETAALTINTNWP